jgi:4,5-dihydroxyphthalate decarboxylase
VPSRIPLTLACGSYDINEALVDGTVAPDGVDLTVLTYPSPERHWRMIRHAEFDACELSLASFLMLHDQGRGVRAIPAFPHRRFRHGSIYVNAAAGIDRPTDLEERRVGLRAWQTTAGLWARGILQDHHGVDLTTIDWVCQDEEDVPFEAPGRFRLRRVADGESVTAMLEQGELDALIYPEVPAAIHRGDPRVRTLFEDPKAEEIAYFEATGFFPIMHTVVIRDPIAEANPWLPRNLLLAFRASKDLAFRRAVDPRRISLAWVAGLIAEQRRILGEDPWSYAFAPNRDLLAQMIRWSHEQGMIARAFDPEELFFPAAIDELPTYV